MGQSKLKMLQSPEVKGILALITLILLFVCICLKFPLEKLRYVINIDYCPYQLGKKTIFDLFSLWNGLLFDLHLRTNLFFLEGEENGYILQ